MKGRFRYYGQLQEKLLGEIGHSVSFAHLTPSSFLKEIKKVNPCSSGKIISTVYQGFKIVKMIEEIEEKARWYRPRELNPGATNKAMDRYLKAIDGAQNLADFKNATKEAKEYFKEIEVEEKDPAKVIIMGEIYCTIDPFINQQTEKKMGEMGIEVHRNVNLSNFVKHGITRYLHDPQMLFKTRKYISSFVGGHGVHSVGEVLSYAQKGFDGVVHIFPFGCMPEITVRPLIQEIGRKKNMPILSLSFDEHSSQTGFQTRIEAFVDLIKNKKQKI